ncbi:MAG: hypothetical protein RL685_5493, partial [Pseudomonadota bacterium]
AARQFLREDQYVDAVLTPADVTPSNTARQLSPAAPKPPAAGAPASAKPPVPARPAP